MEKYRNQRSDEPVMEELGANYAAGVDKLTCNQQNCAQTKTIKTLETRLHLPPYSRNELCSSIRSNFVRKKFFHNHRSMRGLLKEFEWCHIIRCIKQMKCNEDANIAQEGDC